MQPYFLPYIGYFQLIGAVDKFVLYDDVHFINRGFVNRNNLLAGGKAGMFTIPLKEASQNKRIREIQVLPDPAWRKKMLKTVQQSYQKAKMFDTVYPLLTGMLEYEPESIADLCHFSIREISDYLQLTTTIVPSSTVYENVMLKSQERILDICKQEHATVYINPSGGMALYDKGVFAGQGIELCFIETGFGEYTQFKNQFVPALSVLDVLMFNTVAEVKILLQEYRLV